MSAEGTTVGQVGRTRIQMERMNTQSVRVRDSFHSKANFYIKQSRQFFPNTKLRTYIDCPCFLGLARVVCLASVFGCLGLVGVAPKELPLGFCIACAVFLLVYCQHEWVNRMTLPVVRIQPVFDGQPDPNAFYELTITELKGVALENYQAGIGFVRVTQGKIKFQAFNKYAANKISSAQCHSRLMLFFFLLLFALNVYFTVEAYSKY